MALGEKNQDFQLHAVLPCSITFYEEQECFRGCFFLQQVSVLCKEKQQEEGNGVVLCQKNMDTHYRERDRE